MRYNPATVSPTYPSAHILILDDNELITRFLYASLESVGYQQVTCSDKLDGLTFEDAPPDLLLLDLFLPERNGFEVLRELRQQYDFPIIVMSPSVPDKIKTDALEAGAQAFLGKPFQRSEVITLINQMLHTYFSKTNVSLKPNRRDG